MQDKQTDWLHTPDAITVCRTIVRLLATHDEPPQIPDDWWPTVLKAGEANRQDPDPLEPETIGVILYNVCHRAAE